MLSGLIMAFNGVAEFVAPTFMMDTFAYRQVETNDAYWQYQKMLTFDAQTKTYGPRPSENELTAKRLEAFAQAVTEERRLAIQALIKAAIMLAGGILFFLPHWQIAKRQREIPRQV
jgi:hypothetical protein